MINRFKYLTNFKQLRITCWIILSCFALASCTIKEAIFETVGLTFEKPYNKTKSTSTCYATNQLKVKSYKQQQNIKFNVKATDLLPFFVVNHKPYSDSYNFDYHNNSPPKYILYLQLKIAII